MPDTPHDAASAGDVRSADDPGVSVGDEPGAADLLDGADVPNRENPSGARRSVAESRPKASNRVTLIMGAVVLVIIVAVIALGFQMHSKAVAIPADGYGTSTESIATVGEGGVITVAHGDPAVTIDVYVDALGPKCSTFERQYSQQIAKFVDRGQLAVRYHVLDYLNTGSISGDYSTRAYAALLAMASEDGGQPGHFMAFYDSLWDPAIQPEPISEGGKSDLSNADLAHLAAQAGAPDAVTDRITSGADVPAAKDKAAAHLTTLAAFWGRTTGSDAKAPTVLHHRELVHLNDVDWLTKLLASAPETDSG